MPERFEVRASEADQRLDKLLRQRFPNLSFGQTQKLIRGGRVRVDGKRAKAADRPTKGATITLPYQGEGQPQPKSATGLEGLKIFEDDTLMAINKPAGLAVQGGSSLKVHIAKMLEGTDLRLVHRLDRDTSGLLLLAKGALAAKQLTRAFAGQEVEKTYLALVPQADVDEGRLTLALTKVLQGGEGRMAVSPEGQEAVTDFAVLARGPAAVLMALKPKTGRTHQLRVHCAHVFGGIFGDSKYGEAKNLTKGLCLHAWKAGLTHPETGETLSLEAPLPSFLETELAKYDLTLPQTWSPT